ncbi:MAG: hypothetical protein U0Y10_04660 [Spirosomataceae bacterium]
MFTFLRGFFAMLGSAPVSFVGSSSSSVAYFCSVIAPAGVAGAFGCSSTVAAAVSLAWGVRVWGVGIGARLAICCPCSQSSGSFSFRLALSRAARGRGSVLVLPAGVRPAPCFYQALRALGFVRAAVATVRPRVWVCQVSGVAVSLPPLFAWLRV